MHAIAVLSQWLSTRAVIGHRARLSALLKVVEAALLGGALVLTQLGRSRRGAAFEKHHIKAGGLVFGTVVVGARLQVLLLVVALATVALWLAGLAARGLGLSRRFQANTDRRAELPVR